MIWLILRPTRPKARPLTTSGAHALCFGASPLIILDEDVAAETGWSAVVDEDVEALPRVAETIAERGWRIAARGVVKASNALH